MNNLIPYSSFSYFNFVTSGSGVVELVSANTRHLHTTTAGASHKGKAFFFLGDVTFGDVYTFAILARQVSGTPRMWFETFDLNAAQDPSTPEAYTLIDAGNDLQLYRCSIKINNPNVKFLFVVLGGYTADSGEAYWTYPTLIRERDAGVNPGVGRLVKLVAAGTIQYTQSSGAVGVFADNPNFGLGTPTWDTTDKFLTVPLFYFAATGPFAFAGDAPTHYARHYVDVTGYNRGGTATNLLATVRSIDHAKAIIQFIDDTGAVADLAAQAADTYVTVKFWEAGIA